MAPPASSPAPCSAKLPSLPSLPCLPTRARPLLAINDRDIAFDGLFVFAVTTTGIFCRPTCPARRPLPRNTLFFPSASLASRQGLTPFKRCHQPQPSPVKPFPTWAAKLKSQIDLHPTYP